MTTIDEAVAAVTSSIEKRMREIHAKHGDVYFEIERGSIQYPDEAAGYMRTELTDRLTITVDRPRGDAPDSDQ